MRQIWVFGVLSLDRHAGVDHIILSEEKRQLFPVYNNVVVS